MSKSAHSTAWTTAHELAFLRGLGQHCPRSAAETPSRKAAAARRAQLLAGYLAGAQQRTQWPRGLDKTQVLAFCQVQMVETA